MNSKFITVVLCMGLLFSDALADDADVYESLPEVTIGKVFFTTEQRRRLDGLRRRTPSTGQGRASREESRSKAAAGYILRGGGQRKVYAEGDFVAEEVSKEVKFPGDVKVVKVTDVDKTESKDESD